MPGSAAILRAILRAACSGLMPRRGPGNRPTGSEGWEIQCCKVRYPAALYQGWAVGRGLSGGTALYCTITRYAYTAARTACIRGKIDTIRESMPGNSNSPQVPRRVPRMPQGTRRYQLRYPTVFVLTRGRLHTCIDRCNSQHAPGPPPQCLPML